ncbi:MAG: S-adenosylmethionine:tRNA ribosyltransferase-isomerase [Paludibacteraceae bacterium]|nr:S-adenosylmethionine:tRNA ribosyltransferase-isomerase [Paludibacteraceae bacterium]
MEEILIEEYNYPLPDERIAKYPLAQRDHSKLLVYRDGQVQEDVFHHIGQYLSSDSLLIYNNTRVIQARLEFHKAVGDEVIRQVGDKARGARIEIFCLEPLNPHDYQLALGATQGCTWKCMIGNAKKWKSGALSLTTTLSSGQEVTLFAEKGEQTGNTFAVHFSWNLTGVADLNISFAEILDAVGELPIPPYLNRKTEDSDKTTYQTVYSRIKGSVAAPTAGLHFTDQVLDGLRAQGVQTAEVTLHVGAGTFQPVKVANANDHTMHTEVIAVTKDTLIALRDHIGDIVAVGTTSMRTLESLYFIGSQLSYSEADRSSECEIRTFTVSQFAPYTHEYTLSTREALQAIVDYLDATGQDVLHAETQIMIKPGYQFRVVDKLITNFHQPKSTLLLLVSAFVSGDWHTIYDYALAHDFRFLSYGDSSILFRRNPAPNAAAPRC